jgi:hypothetical protein
MISSSVKHKKLYVLFKHYNETSGILILSDISNNALQDIGFVEIHANLNPKTKGFMGLHAETLPAGRG